MSLVAFRALVRKDVLLFVRDRRAVVFSVLTPILIAAFFGMIMGSLLPQRLRNRHEATHHIAPVGAE